MSGPSDPRLGADASREAELAFESDEPSRLPAISHDLERLAASGNVLPSTDFADRVLAAIAREPLPRPTVAAGSALRNGRPRALATAIIDSWRVAWSGGRPIAIRAQAAAVVLVAVLVLGSVGGIAAVGAWSALGPQGEQPFAPTIGPVTTAIPSPSPAPASPHREPTASPKDSATPEDSPHPARTPRPTQHATPKPTDTPDATDDHDGEPGEDGSGSGGSGDGSSGSDGSSGGPTASPSDGGGGGSDD